MSSTLIAVSTYAKPLQKLEAAIRAADQAGIQAAITAMSDNNVLAGECLLLAGYSFELRQEPGQAASYYAQAHAICPDSVPALGLQTCLQARCAQWERTHASFAQIHELVGEYGYSILGTPWATWLQAHKKSYPVLGHILDAISGPRLAIATISHFFNAACHLKYCELAQQIMPQMQSIEDADLKACLNYFGPKLTTEQTPEDLGSDEPRVEESSFAEDFADLPTEPTVNSLDDLSHLTEAGFDIEFDDAASPPTPAVEMAPAPELLPRAHPLPTKPPRLKLVLDLTPNQNIQISVLHAEMKKLNLAQITSDNDRRRKKAGFYQARLLLYHPMEDASAGFCRLLRDAGFSDIVEVSDPQSAMTVLRNQDIGGIVAFFLSEVPTALDFLRNLSHARDLEHFPTVVFTTGDEGSKGFEAAASEFAYDGISVVQHSRTKIDAIVQKIYKSTQSERSLGGILDSLRRPWLRTRLREQRLLLPVIEADRHCALLHALRPRSGFADRERLWQAISKGQSKVAEGLVKKLRIRYPRDYQIELADFQLQAQGGKYEETALAMVDSLSTLPELSTEILYQLSQICYEWAAPKALGRLVKIWSQHGVFSKDPQLYFAAARFYRIINDLPTAKSLQATACQAQPLRGEFQLELGEILFAENDFKRALELYTLAAEAVHVDRRYASLRIAECLFKLRKNSEAQKCLQDILQAAPHDAAALELKQKYLAAAAA